MTNADALVALLTEREPSNGRLAVTLALDGRSAAGKSTLAERLSGSLDAVVIHMDDFYRDEPEDVRLAHDASEGFRRYFDWERLLEQALLPLSAGVPALFRPFNWAAMGGLGEPITIEPARVVIVEGVYSARAELRPHLDVCALVEAAEATRTARRRVRRDPHDWEARWDLAESLYFATVSKTESFDIVLSTDPE